MELGANDGQQLAVERVLRSDVTRPAMRLHRPGSGAFEARIGARRAIV
jgi:hypothetical protein